MVLVLVTDSGVPGSGDVMAGAQLVCDLGVQVLQVDGAAVLTRGRQDASALLYATDPVIARLDDLEFVTGEGPCLEAFWNHRPVLEPDLGGGWATTRWPWFAPEAVAIGAGAVFAFPLHAGDIEFGVFWLFRRASADLTDRELSVAQGLAQTAAAVVLTGVAENSTDQLNAHFRASPFGRVDVDQAIGVIAVQRHSDIEEARLLLRGTAYAQNRSSRAVAKDVLAHRLTFPPDSTG